FRRRSEAEERPEQIHGNKTLEIAWTILPAVILLVIFIPTVQTMFNTHAEAEEKDADYIIDVYGKQWWWEVHWCDYRQRNPYSGGQARCVPPLLQQRDSLLLGPAAQWEDGRDAGSREPPRLHGG
ncbi:MAG: hypothetical protein C4346_18615, partial [Chloroflexota bacterium]